MTALGSAKGGDTILLKAGDYSGLSTKYLSLNFTTPVTITSADPSHQATFTTFLLNKVNGLTFSNVEFKVAVGKYDFGVTNSSNIHFDNVYFHGSLDNDSSNDQSGIGFQNSTNISITNSEFEQLNRAVSVSSSKNFKFAGNDLHDLRSDGIDLAQVSNVEISGNSFKNFRPVGSDHPDAIQFWTTGTTEASRDIVIKDNVIMKGEGADTQGIFLRDQVGTLPYENVTIANNLIVGTGYNGITVKGAKDVTFANNKLITFAGGNNTWLLADRIDGVVATGNQGTILSFEKSTHVLQDSNVLTKAVTDQGASALMEWKSALASGSFNIALPTAEELMAKAVQVQAALPPPPVDQHLVGTTGNDNLVGGVGNDTLESGGRGADTLTGGAGDDVYVLPTKESTIVELAGGGKDTVIAMGEHRLAANVENLTFYEDGKGWRGYGNELDNQLTGNSGNNQLDGGAGNDTINGGAGMDSIIGGAGNDYLIGGDGYDVFTFRPGGGQDTIADIASGAGQDTIDIYAYSVAGMKPIVKEVDGHAVISFSNGDSISVLGVHASDLGAYSKTGWVI